MSQESGAAGAPTPSQTPPHEHVEERRPILTPRYGPRPAPSNPSSGEAQCGRTNNEDSRM